MSLCVVKTSDERPLGAAVERALREGMEKSGSAVLLVPSFQQALDLQRQLSTRSGLALGVSVTTPAAWVKERWEVWGDGRAIASSVALQVTSRAAIVGSSASELGPIELSEGLVGVLSQIVDQALPWVPARSDGSVDRDACLAEGLTGAETTLLELAAKTRELLAGRGLVSTAEAASTVVERLVKNGAGVPPVVVAGFTQMSRRDCQLVADLSAHTELTFVAAMPQGPASMQVQRLVDQLCALHGEGSVAVDDFFASDDTALERDPRLAKLRDVLFTGGTAEPGADGPVRLLLAAGPLAEAELVAQATEQLQRELGAQANMVIATPNVERANRELVPKLVARGVSVRLQQRRALLDCPAAQAFLSFVSLVAQLSELAAKWPEPAMGLEGPMAQLGDMSWWPPRELSDFMLSDISHVGATKGWRADSSWRGNRLLSPQRLLEMLQSERESSPAVARATAELLRGRIGTAASKLLAPYVFADDDPDAASAVAQPRDDETDEAMAVLQGFLRLAGTLRELGVTADPSVEGSVTLSELVEVIEWAATGMSVVTRVETAHAGNENPVSIMTPAQAAGLAPASVDALVVCGLTTAEQPISAGEDLLKAVLEQLAIEPKADPMARARSDFYRLVSVPTRVLVLERALYDADSKETYPSVMLSELLSVYAGAERGAGALPTTRRVETELSANLDAEGKSPSAVGTCDPAPAGRLSADLRPFVFVPQDGTEHLRDGKPVLSASQIETYLDCPYKWFSLRRLRLGTVDAGHTGMEMGTFAHRVLEVTHRELLARALEAQQPGVSRDELLAQIEANPACHIEGSRVTEENLERAVAALDLEFDLHQQHMYMVRKPGAAQQLLIAHDSTERAQEDQLRRDLQSAMRYQTRILAGFEPRLFEWSFGRRGKFVEYAGAYFTGTVDRIDVSPHGTAVIIDYKHKSPNGFAAEYDALQDGVLAGEKLPNRVQSLIYAQVVRRAFEGRLRLVGTTYLSTKSPHALAGAASENVVDLVFGRITAARAPRVCVPAELDGTDGMDALLDRTEELVAEQVKEMLAGNVEARPRDKRSCDFCPVMQCERRVAR